MTQDEYLDEIDELQDEILVMKISIRDVIKMLKNIIFDLGEIL